MSITIEWKQPATTVIVTGTFDNWSQSVSLQNENGVFRTTVEIKETPVVFKFVVDGEWVLSNDYPVVTDAQGNQNHQLEITTEATPAETTPVETVIETVQPALSVSPSEVTVSHEEPVATPLKQKKGGLKRKLTKLWNKMVN